jgi:cohesin complex subunit SCC1
VCAFVLTDKTSTPLACVAAPKAPESLWEESVNARRRLSYEHAESVHCCKDTGSTERESILDASRKRKLDEGIDFEASVGCHTHTENGPVQDGFCECNEGTAKEKGPQVEGDEPSSEIPSTKGLHESENRILLHNEAPKAALDNLDEVIFCTHQTRMICDENSCI